MIPLYSHPYGRMPLEMAEPERILATTPSLQLEELDYPVRRDGSGFFMIFRYIQQAFTFRLKTLLEEASENPMATGLWSVVSVLLELDIPHNILICQR